MLFISSFQVIILIILLLALVITALVFASRSTSNLRFLIWGAVILFVPVVGALACIINYYTSDRKVKINKI
ncbi:hypothetical protein [Polaribacter tangerinus]|uniref:hypothetical protein n=1 Tax=Polaribacter tangerinus TaxID=1920034 RepID=UPI000B4A7996|nr:hypothetical protein [Polaribacter tangerinus]